MSDLLNSASLVLIPSGYAEDIVYSEIPLDGSGDMVFTRASNGTRINSAGLVEVTPWNLVGYSEDFSVGWNIQGASITSNSIVAPNGTTTADSLIASNGVNGASGVYVPQTTIGVKTISCYVKKGSKRWASLIAYNGNSNCWYDLDNGVVGTRGAYYSTSSITSVGNGWFRIDAVMTVAIGSDTNIGIYATDNDNSLTCTGDGTTVSSYIWGFQLNIGATAKPYFPTTDRLNVPRLTYQNGGGGCPSLLLEKQSTNYVLSSQNLTTYWTLSDTNATANSTTSPDGTTNASKLDNGLANAQHRYFQNVLNGLTNETLSFSIYAKQGTHRYISWGITDNTAYRGQVVVDLQTGTITDQFTDNSTLSNLSVASQGNGWYRISGTMAVSSNYAGGSAYAFGLMLNSSSWSTAGYVGTGTYCYLWGGQAELSTYPTSYIPTTSASATRVADACFKTGISSLIGQTEGTIFVDATNLFTSGNRTLALLYTSGSAFYQVYINSSNQIRVDVNGSFLFLGVSITANTRYKIAFAYKSGDNALYINGTQIATSASTTIPSSLNDYYVGNAIGSEQSGSYGQAILFPTRLTNAELASLTTI